MFYSLFKSVLHVSPVHKLQCLQKYTSVLSLRCISSNANQHSFTVSYLINSCGLSLESALSASKHVHFETPDKPDSVLDFFQNHGFTKTQITILTKRLPRVLLSSPQKTLFPKLEFFNSKGISNHDCVKMLAICPGLLHRSVDKHMIPTFNSLCNLLQSGESTISVVKRCPEVLLRDFENFLAANIKILRDSGVPQSNILKAIEYWPEVSVSSPKHLEKNVALIKDMGINTLRSQFVIALKAKTRMSKSLWQRKLDLYKRWGWSDEEFFAAFAKYPWCMIASMDKITAAMEFFVNKMGWESSVIAKHPILTALSMEKRIIPRSAVIQFLLSKGLIKSNITTFITMLLLPEKTFVQRFMNSYNEAPQLLKLYKDKLDLAKKKCSV